MIRFIVMPMGSERGEKTLEEKNGGCFFFFLITYQSICKFPLLDPFPKILIKEIAPTSQTLIKQ